MKATCLKHKMIKRKGINNKASTHTSDEIPPRLVRFATRIGRKCAIPENFGSSRKLRENERKRPPREEKCFSSVQIRPVSAALDRKDSCLSFLSFNIK